MTAIAIREVREDDDFQRIYDLNLETGQRMNRQIGLQQRIRCAPPNSLKLKYFPNEDNSALLTKCKGFIAEFNGQMVAYMDVTFPEHSNNGYVSFGYSEGYEHVIQDLLDRCCAVVKLNGGTKLYQYAVLIAGQIRNYQITFWEKYGYIADPYFFALIKLEVDEWTAPANINNEGIDSAQLSTHEVIQILREDGEEHLAHEWKEEISFESPDIVTLTLRDLTSNEILALSYYRVAHFKDKRKEDGKVYDGLGAWRVGFHFRPKYLLSRQEKRRFIDGTIQSMKELDIIFASARVSSRDFTAFVELMSTGFCFQAFDPLPIVNARLTLEVKV